MACRLFIQSADLRSLVESTSVAHRALGCHSDRRRWNGSSETGLACSSTVRCTSPRSLFTSLCIGVASQGGVARPKEFVCPPLNVLFHRLLADPVIQVSWDAAALTDLPSELRMV